MPRKKATPVQRPFSTWEREKPILDVHRVALLLGMGEHTICKLARAGEIPAFKAGPKLWRFSRDQIRAWAEGVTANAIR